MIVQHAATTNIGGSTNMVVLLSYLVMKKVRNAKCI